MLFLPEIVGRVLKKCWVHRQPTLLTIENMPNYGTKIHFMYKSTCFKLVKFCKICEHFRLLVKFFILQKGKSNEFGIFIKIVTRDN